MSERLRQFHSSKGASAVELALVLTFLLLVLFGILAFGGAYRTQLSISNAAREGARLASVGRFDEAAVRQSAAPTTPDSITVRYPNGNVRGEPVEVTVTDRYRIEIPFYGTRDVELHSTVVMRIEV